MTTLTFWPAGGPHHPKHPNTDLVSMLPRARTAQKVSKIIQLISFAGGWPYEPAKFFSNDPIHGDPLTSDIQNMLQPASHASLSSTEEHVSRRCK